MVKIKFTKLTMYIVYISIYIPGIYHIQSYFIYLKMLGNKGFGETELFVLGGVEIGCQHSFVHRLIFGKLLCFSLSNELCVLFSHRNTYN